MKKEMPGQGLLKKRRKVKKVVREINHRILELHEKGISGSGRQPVVSLFQQVQELMDLVDEMEIEYSRMCEVMHNIVLQERRRGAILEEALHPLIDELSRGSDMAGRSRLKTVIMHLDESEEAVLGEDVHHTPLTDMVQASLPRRVALFQETFKSTRS